MSAPRTGPTRRGFLATTGAIGTGILAGVSARGDSDVPLAPPDKQPAGLEVPLPVERKVGWAVVGLGTLALGEVMPAFAECRYAKPMALVSGHPDKARQVAEVYGIDAKNIYDYQSYDRITENPAVDVIYIILPNSMHAEYTIRGHKAGKHVLCEKPMAVSTDECQQMIASANDNHKKLMIAYRLRYEPFNKKVIELCDKQELGKIKLIATSNCQNVTAPNIRLSRKLGGGPVGDLGIYCLNAARYITGNEPVEASAFAHQPSNDPRFREVPESVAFSLQFDDGVIAHCGCSFGTAESRYYRIMCEHGTIELDNAFGYRGQELYISKGKGKTRLKISPVNHFAAEMDHFSECILNDRQPRTPGSDGLADMQAIAAIQEAAESGRSVAIGT
jgi:predicted dehydrogenase